jgi:hypothetical protein
MIKMPSNWTIQVTEDGQIDVNFTGEDGEGHYTSGGALFSRAVSLSIALAVLERRTDADIAGLIAKDLQ